MTGHSPESTTGRLPENMDEENIEDDGFQDAVTERTVEVENTDEDEATEQNGNGYVPLPTSAEGSFPEEDEDSDEVEFGYSTFDGEQFTTRTSRDYRQLLESRHTTSVNPSNDSNQAIPLDGAQIETIKSIMSNITIPTTAVPDWATTISDDQLKIAVEEKLVSKKPEEEGWANFD